MRKLTYLVAVLLVLSALPRAARAADAPTPPKVGEKIVDFTLRDVKGRKISTAKARKGKIFVLKFGATWCGWCNRQVPHLNRVVKEYGKKVRVIDVDVREEADRVKAHNKRLGAKYLTVLDTTGAVAARYGVRGIPVVIIADKEGTILFHGNYTPFDQLKKVIDNALAKDEENKKEDDPKG